MQVQTAPDWDNKTKEKGTLQNWCCHACACAASGRAVSFALAPRYRITICSFRTPLVHSFMYTRTVKMPHGIALIEQRVRSLHNSVGLATSLVTGPVIDHLAARLFLLFGKPIPPACSFHLHGFTSLAKGFLCVRTLVPRFRRC